MNKELFEGKSVREVLLKDSLDEGVFDFLDKDKRAANQARNQTAKLNTQKEKDAKAQARAKGGKAEVDYSSEEGAATNATVDTISADFQKDVNNLWSKYLQRLTKNFGANFEKAPANVQSAIGVIGKNMKDLGAELGKIKGSAIAPTTPETPPSTETPKEDTSSVDNKEVSAALRALKFKNDQVSRMMNHKEVKDAKTVADKVKAALQFAESFARDLAIIESHKVPLFNE